jgi:hypothetical protein
METDAKLYQINFFKDDSFKDASKCFMIKKSQSCKSTFKTFLFTFSTKTKRITRKEFLSCRYKNTSKWSFCGSKSRKVYFGFGFMSSVIMWRRRRRISFFISVLCSLSFINRKSNPGGEK